MSAVRIIAVSSILLLTAFVFLQGAGSEISLLNTQEDFTDRFDGNWADNGSLDNLEETSDGYLTLEETDVQADEYDSTVEYREGWGVYDSDTIRSNGSMNIDSLTARANDLDSDVNKATIFIQYLEGEEIVDEENVTLDDGFNQDEDVASTTENVDGYRYDILLETNDNDDNLVLENVVFNGATFDGVVSQTISQYLAELLFLVIIGIALLYMASAF